MNYLIVILILVLLPVQASGQLNQLVVNMDISADEYWSSDTEYILDGLVFVEQGVTLTIEAGTLIRGLDSINISTGEAASALIVERNARLIAEGRPGLPLSLPASMTIYLIHLI